MRVAITGAGGFLGKEVIRHLLRKENCTVIAFTSQKAILEETFKTQSLIVYDRNDFKNGGFNNVDVLLNCAFPRNNDGVQMALGLVYIKEVLEEAVKDNVGKVINISSQSVYSQNKVIPATENSEISLDSTYAVGKYASELLTNAICSDIMHTNLRLASLIGSEFNQRVVNKMIDSAFEHRKIVFLGGEQKFGFMDITDAAEAILAVINSEEEDFADAYNIGIDGGYSLETIANFIKERLLLKGINIDVEKSSNEVFLNSEIDNKRYCDKFGKLSTKSIVYTIDKIINEKINRIMNNKERVSNV